MRGTVQGVGFRPFVFRHANELGLAGFVLNDSAGVLIEAEGPPEALDELARRLAEDPPPLARVASVEVLDVPWTAGSTRARPTGFRIVASEGEGVASAPVGVDAATCADCLAEV
ncbi:MAG: acylphosphatase, partial [Acidimicrobiales bacterium]